jgi:prepilin-type N-terminal cleavage/methylation domain-containing protein
VSMQDERGFTLVEMLFVCIILGVVMAGLTTVFVSGSQAELNLNYRYQAQQSARLALNQLRLDAHAGCAANVGSGGALATIAYVPSDGATACGSQSTYSKVLWCALTSPTSTGQYALYRSTSSTCTAANGKLEADNLNTSAVFALTASSPSGSIPVGQLQTLQVDVPVEIKHGTAGTTYTLAQTLTLQNGVYQTVGTSGTCTGTNCSAGICPLTGNPCYPPVIAP